MESSYKQKFIAVPKPDDPIKGMQIFVWFFAWFALVLDIMDWQFVTVAASAIIAEFQFPKAAMGLILGGPLLGAGLGGLVSGWLSDKFGRVRLMVYCIIWYSLFTIVFAFASSYESMLALRIIVGLGLGAQWGVGNTLVAEVMPQRIRIMCSAVIQTGFPIGSMLAAYVAKLVLPSFGWRPLFYFGALGIIMAVIAWIFIPEPEAWLKKRDEAKTGTVKMGDLSKFFEPGLRLHTFGACGLVWITLLAYWGAGSWIPNWLVTDRGMNIVKSMDFIIWLNVGAIFGFIVFAAIADRWGRKPPAYAALVASFLAVLAFVSIDDPIAMLVFAPILSFITYPIFGLYGGYLSELFPTEIRATAVNGIYNLGRMTAFLGPVIMGAVSGYMSMTFAIGISAVLYLVAIVPLFFLPETLKKKEQVASVVEVGVEIAK
jgi:AAHS family cis,cis-muconate transporter-like MFS transporter